MPTELEYKYVLKNRPKLHKLLEGTRCQNIEQGYLAYNKGMSARIRHIVSGSKEEWRFTFKQKVANRVVELEHKIDQRDAQDLWDYCVGKLRKRRFIVDADTKWEVDFFYDLATQDCYFVMAEVELPEGTERPGKLPKVIGDYLLHEVAIDDSRFSNKRLGDINYAKELYQTLTDNQLFHKSG